MYKNRHYLSDIIIATVCHVVNNYLLYFLELFINCNNDTSIRNSSLFSSEGELSERSNDSWCEQDPIPFTVSPDAASILPGQEQIFKVTFAPDDVFQYEAHLESTIQNLKPRCQNMNIVLKGMSVLPLCHFDIEPLSGEEIREGRKVCGEEENENLKIVKFEAVGLKEAKVQ